MTNAELMTNEQTTFFRQMALVISSSVVIRFFVPKKVPPPTPDRREGRLFPPEQSLKTSRLLNELVGRRNKILHEIFRRSRGCKEDIAAPGADDGSFD